MIHSLDWNGDCLEIIDQTLLPVEKSIRNLNTLESVFEAIQKLRVRGAPAIGVAAAFGVVTGLKSTTKTPEEILSYLAQSRPTAVNLFWALDRVKSCIEANKNADRNQLIILCLDEAKRIQEDDREKCKRIGEFGADLIEDGMTIMTYCNTGYLATAGIGTALGVIYTAIEQGKQLHVYVNETRPLLQGARLTAWELMEEHVPCTLIADNMAAHVMKTKQIDLVIVGADRIAANGDTANKIGTYSLAINAKAHTLPFFVAAPSSTFDLQTKNGTEIEIEERNPSEVRTVKETALSRMDVPVFNPAFDVTNHKYISAFITELGLIKPDYSENIQKQLQRKSL